MVLREELVASAVTFLQDPSVSASPLENRIAFLQSKNLTQEEIDIALVRTSSSSAPSTNYPGYGSKQQVTKSPLSSYGGYQQYPWQQPPQQLPRRDWRDWFIMATIMGGVSYGLYTVAKRYVIPLIAPPTPPQLEQDKAAIDASFDKAFSLLDQLAKDTEALKVAEATRTERLDNALAEVESVTEELKSSSERRENESQRIGDEVRGLKDLIPRAMDAQKENTDNRLKELNAELKSLKMLMGQRMNPPPTPSGTNSPLNRFPDAKVNTSGPPVSRTSDGPAPSGSSKDSTTSTGDGSVVPKPASVSSGGTIEAVASLPAVSQNRPFSPMVPLGRASIPAWQMTAANKSSKSSDSSGSAATTPKDPGSGV